MTDLNTLWPFEIRRGSSDDPRNGACTMDAVSWFRHGQLGDHPECACPVLTEFVIYAQDAMPDAVRQRLMRPRIPYLIDSRDPNTESARLRCIVLETARRIVPAAFDETERIEAETLRTLSDDTSYGEIIDALDSTIPSKADEAVLAALAAADCAKKAENGPFTCSAVLASAEAASAASAAYEAVLYQAGDAAGEERVCNVWASILDEALALGKTGGLDIETARQRVKEFEAAAGATALRSA